MNVTTKFFLAAAIAAAAGSAATAQQYRSRQSSWGSRSSRDSEAKIYIRAGGGYSFGAGKASMDYNESEDEYDITKTNVPASLGKGISYDLGVGYMLNPYIGFELGARGLIGLNNTFERTYEMVESAGYTGYRTDKVAYSGFALVPALRVVAPVGETFSFYSRVGVSLPLFGKMTFSHEGNESNVPVTGGEPEQYSNSQAREYTSYFKVGYSAALGVEVALGEHFSLFGEVNGLVASFEAKKETLTKYIRDGKDELAGMSESEKVTEYTKEQTFDYYRYHDGDRVTDDGKAVSFTLPASSIGITVGVALKF
jgi:hypothetical protein